MTNNLKAEWTLTAEEQRSIVDGEWWKSICEPCGLIVRGFTYRNSALVTDKDTGQAVTIPGWLARRLESISTQQPMGEVRVKALEWVEVTSPREDGPPEPIGEYVAETPFGSYYIDMYFGTDSYGWSANFEASDIEGSDSDSPEKAKAAAQADYERGIRSALHPNQESGE